MPTIRPSSDLRNNYNEICEFCHKYTEPVFITKNGTGDPAVMSIKTYELLDGKVELYKLLEEGLESDKTGKTRPMDEVFSSIREKLNL